MTQMENETGQSQSLYTVPDHGNKRRYLPIAVLVVVVILFSVFYSFFISSPDNFPQDSVVSIVPGESLKMVVEQFRNAHLIRSSSVFQSLVIMFGGEKKVIAGDYLFATKESAIHLAWRVVGGDFGMQEIKVTIPEGFSVSDISHLLEQKLVEFNAYAFLEQAKNDEGYLFPDTYFFPPTATSSDIISRMKENYNLKIQPFLPAIATSTHSEADIITMASILEDEATSTADRQIVAGILWKRLKEGVPLQVDSTLRYVTGRASKDLTVADLELNSPYNTYRFKGLPPTPIDNPGADSIYAALHPIPTKYFYFLSDNAGIMHYATTFAEHQANIQKYLR